MEGIGTRLSRTGGGSRRGVIAALLLAAALVGIGLGFGLGFARGRRAPSTVETLSRNGLDGQATWAAGARAAPAITTLRDQTGRTFSLASLRGHVVAIVFFDSYCRQECPLEGRALAAAERALPAASRPVLVAVSVDPLDTLKSVRAAAHSWGLGGVAAWHWLMGTRPELAPVWKAYHIYVGPRIDGDIAHTEALYLVDRRGDERAAYLYPFATRFVTHDLRVLASAGRT
jgi:cytochrome oxidase Cu insertion factor (SCO1/SenC/PrrC family)